ncbi:PRC-barrel domain-containing protein [Hahella aquimaris]|uniref:PRC-barrel domain-containing protein n=1 Tax=Hahella sp. HNIBRBA332 TaxID=3015983 RepID=UPI00273B47FA|nr:PRC-barrel domain-containing protein [Hahella sp. HNIBRBA332]WLQ16713.1 PRC-barrel domain-containing protein [Hahella sp. HNIBRBA332]
MLRTIKDLEGYAIGASDGGIGQVKDFYFDDESWAVRYLVVETGSWLASRKVLISPISIGVPDWGKRTLPVLISQQQIKDSPGIDTDKPVSRQHEMHYMGYYDYPYYWRGDGLWGGGAYPGALTSDANDGDKETSIGRAASEDGQQAEDIHLRSANAVMRYHIEASDGFIGHVENMLLNVQTWAIRYLVVNTSNWWQGHQVLIAPKWIKSVDWDSVTVTVNLTRQALREAPAFDTRKYLHRL